MIWLLVAFSGLAMLTSILWGERHKAKHEKACQEAVEVKDANGCAYHSCAVFGGVIPATIVALALLALMMMMEGGL